jgi:hypothetical protein
MGAGASRTVDMSEQEQAEIRLEFARLKQEHADFDAAINAMIATGCDPLQDPAHEEEEAGAQGPAERSSKTSIIPDIIA